MERGALGRVCEDGEVIIREGEPGNCMFVIQEGQVEVFRDEPERGGEIRLGVLSQGDFFGEMALFEREPRAASVRALGRVRAITVDKRTLLRRIQEDPSLAVRLVQKLSQRVRELDARLQREQG